METSKCVLQLIHLKVPKHVRAPQQTVCEDNEIGMDGAKQRKHNQEEDEEEEVRRECGGRERGTELGDAVAQNYK